jgi:hypothetical protein
LEEAMTMEIMRDTIIITKVEKMINKKQRFLIRRR